MRSRQIVATPKRVTHTRKATYDLCRQKRVSRLKATKQPRVNDPPER
ncbi:hypothetical protein PLANPX_2355 [Lacipirellula parvula]|uniref:Uncharacterized protein n=1 Tax=Lacipirellula parvula TaxID=2650471 RepID=A0A5K7XET9_9BACT|nr:hypothetical protein PLANPX_2355 [Lacipirellula parvula]